MAALSIGAGALLAAYGYKCYKEVDTTIPDSEVYNRSAHPRRFIPDYKSRGDQHFWTEATDEVPILVSEEGFASYAPVTLMEAFKAAKEANGDSRALVSCDFTRTWTWNQYYDQTLQVARAFVKLGVKDYGSICIIGFNSPEWLLSNMGAIACGTKAAGIYPTNGPEAAAYIANHSEAQVILCENAHQAKKFIKTKGDLPNVSTLVVWSGPLPEASVDGLTILNWEDFMALGADAEGELANIVAERIARLKPGHCCELVYTSGTTGSPKAVMISHDNLVWTTRCLIDSIDDIQFDHEFLSYLPLSHVAAQLLDIHLPIVIGMMNVKSCVTFARPDALKGTLGDSLKKVRPTIFFGVPRVWEKIHEKMTAAAATTTGLKKKIAVWAKSIGQQNWLASQLPNEGSRTKPSPPLLYGLADKLVFQTVKERLGLDRCLFFVSGAAPITKDTNTFFGSLGIPIIEIYGMSESTGPVTVGLPKCYRIGTVGSALCGLELKIDHDASRDEPGCGEVSHRGRNIMMGYFKAPAKSAEAIDKEGWLHSGDVGHIDEFGLLSITGRIKELIITAGGENIAPVPIEDGIRSQLPGISHIMMAGDKRKYNVCLITLFSELDEKTGRFTNKLAGSSLGVNGSTATTTQEARDCPKWQEYITEGINYNNSHAISNAQKIQKFCILDEDFSVNSDDLTPTMKLKRSKVAEKYSAEIESLYA